MTFAPESGKLFDHIWKLLEARELVAIWTWRDFKVRYSQSLLGAAWAIIQPLSLMLVFSVIFSLFVKVPTGGIPYPVLSYSALLPWTFFANGLSTAIPSLVSNLNLVGKIYFPREVLPLSAILVCLFDFLVAALIFFAMLAFYQIPVAITILFVPLIMFVQFLLMLGLALIGAALNVFYRDIRFLIPLCLQIWMYVSPVIYPLEVVPAHLRPFYLLNPMATLIDSYRRVMLLGQAPDWLYFGTISLASLLLLIGAYRYFKWAEQTFADRI